MTDPKNKYVPFKKPKKIYIDGKDVATLPRGYRGDSMHTVDVKDTVKKVESGVKHKPSGATMKATKATSGKAKRKFKTNYKSTGSKKGKSTPGRKRRRGA